MNNDFELNYIKEMGQLGTLASLATTVLVGRNTNSLSDDEYDLMNWLYHNKFIQLREVHQRVYIVERWDWPSDDPAVKIWAL